MTAISRNRAPRNTLRTKNRLKRHLGLAAVAALLAATIAPLSAATPAHAAAGDCTGVVFRDHNADGVRQEAGDPTGNGVDTYDQEPGEPGIIVTAYDDSGASVGTTTTLADGTFDLSTTADPGTPIRIEFTWTEDWMTSGPHGPDNGSSVQFASVGSCSLTFGVMNPADYCDVGPYLTIPCYRQGLFDAPSNAGTNDAMVTIGYEWGQDTPNPDANQANWKPTWQVDETGTQTSPLGTADSLEVGTVWGETWNATEEVLYAAAYMKVAADFGPGGPGAIYSVPMNPETGLRNGPVTEFADLSDLGFDVCSDPHGPDLTDPAVVVPTVTDATYGAVGKCALGGLAIDDLDETLYVVNLTSRELVALDVASGTVSDSWGFLGVDTPRCPNPATDLRPFALEWHDGNLYAGAVCSAESTGSDSDLQGYVYEVDPASGSFELVLDYQLQSESILWRAWETTLADASTEAGLTTPSWLNGNGWVVHPTPLLTDIGFYNQDLLLGFRDMFSDKTGRMIAIPEFSAVQPAGLWVGPSTGDLACAGYTADAADPTNGTWQIEEANVCGDRAALNAEGPNIKESSATDPVGLEFYQDGGGALIGTFDYEIHLGAVAAVPGLPLVQTSVNPSEHIGQIPRIVWSSGVVWNENAQGSALRGYLVYAGSGPTDISNFGKTSGLGDIEALCTLAPLEIGNYVWYDADGDGIQSPSEEAVAGATVNLYDGAGNLVATTTTDSAGRYYFDVDAETDYVIRMDNAADFAAGGPLSQWSLTVDSADDDDDADSDGVIGTDGFPEISYTSGRAGANDHTLDFGYVNRTFDVALIKQLDDGTNLGSADPGDEVTFTLTVFNQGEVDATDLVVTDYVPAGLTLADADWTDQGDGTADLAVPIALLAAGDSTTVDITFTVDADADGLLVNWAEISSVLDDQGNPVEDIDSIPNDDQTDDNQPTGPNAPGDDVIDENGREGGDEDDHDVAGIEITPEAPIFDVALIKQLDDGTNLGSADPGDEVTFTLTVFNQGEVDATDLVVTDYVPAGLTLADADWTDQGDGTADLAVPIALLAAGDSTTVDITFTVDADADGLLVNWAEISSVLDDQGNPVEDIDSIPNDDQTDDNQPTGPNAPGDDVIDENGREGGDEDDHDVAGIEITPEAPIFDVALIKQLDDGTNLGSADPGDEVTFTLTVFNQGEVDATDLVVTDYVPAGLTLADADWTDQGDGTADLAVPIALLAAGDSTTVDITFTVDADADGLLVNWAEISSVLDDQGNPVEDIDSIPNDDQTDDNQPTGPNAPGDDVIDENGREGGDEDDHDVAGVQVSQVFDLALIKQLSDGSNLGTFAPGDEVTFTLTVINQGAVDATDVVVTDYIPDGLTLADADWTDQGDGTADLAVPIALLAAGDSTTVDITFTVDADADGLLVNWAEISSVLDDQGNPVEDIDSIPNDDQTDDNQPTGPNAPGDDVIDENGREGGDEDDHDVAGVQVSQVFDLALIKQLSDGSNLGTFAPGDEVTFTLTVINQGAVDATDVVVTDYIPDGLTLADADWTDQGDGTADLAVPIALLAAGDSTTVDITFTVDADADGLLVNWAEISSVLDDQGNPVEDIDSIPNDDQTDDNQPTGPNAPGDDVIDENGREGGDEDDHDVAGVQITPPFDLALFKQLAGGGNVATVEPGDEVTFTLTVINQGGADATNVMVTDYLPPANLTLADPDWIDQGDGTADLATPIAFLGAGDSTTVGITFVVDDDADPVMVDNWAEISAASDENGNPVEDIDSVPDDVNNDTFTQDDDVTGNGRSGGDEDDHDRAQIVIERVDILGGGITIPPPITPDLPPDVSPDVVQPDLVRTGIDVLGLGLLGLSLIAFGLFLSLKFSERAGTRRGSAAGRAD